MFIHVMGLTMHEIKLPVPPIAGREN